jgi:hypothetical protein
MYTFDLNKIKGDRLQKILSERVGLNKNIINKRSVAGFYFNDVVDGSKIQYRVIIEEFPRGMALYCRNRYHNFLLLIPYDELQCLYVNKEADIIAPFSYSWYSILRRLGFSYWISKSFLLENEIIKSNNLVVKFITKDEKILKIYSDKNNISKAEYFFTLISPAHILECNIETFQIDKSFISQTRNK